MSVQSAYVEHAIQPQAPAGPRGYPLVGILPLVWREPLKYLVDISRKYGDVIPLELGREHVLMLTRPEHIKHVLHDNAQNYRKSNYYKNLRPVIGAGMLMAEGKPWRRQRQAAQPAFQGKRLAALTTAMTDAVDDMLDRWRARFEGGQSFDLSVEMTRITLDVVFRTLMNVRLKDQTDLVFDSLMTVLRETERRVWSLTDITNHLPTKSNREYRRGIKVLEDLVYRVIAHRRKDPGEHNDMLSLLFAAYEGEGTPEETSRLLRDEVMTSVIAGHETTASALTWTWYLLSKNPTVARRVRAEAESVLEGRVPVFEDISKLVYTKMVILEALRLYPPAWTMSRTALGEDRIGGCPVPEGTTIMLSPYIVHRNPDIWENPEGFDPERFSPERVKSHHPYAFFPFGGGPRVCIGQRFAIMEAQLILAMLTPLYGIDLVPGHPIEPEAMITLRPRYGAMVTLRKRNADGAG